MEFKADRNSLAKSLAKFMGSERYCLIYAERGDSPALLRSMKYHMEDFENAYQSLDVKSIEAVDAVNEYLSSDIYHLLMVERGDKTANEALKNYVKKEVLINTPIDTSATQDHILVAKEEFVKGYRYSIIKIERGIDKAIAEIPHHLELFSKLYDKIVVNPEVENKVEPIVPIKKEPGFFRGFFNREEKSINKKIKI